MGTGVLGKVRRVVTEVIEEHDGLSTSGGGKLAQVKEAAAEQIRSYASAVGSSRAEVRVSGGPTVELTNTTSFIIAPDNKHTDKYSSSQATKKALSKAFKPSDCGLKVKRIALIHNNAVKIEAYSPDLAKIREHSGLRAAGLMMQENIKINPRLIVYGVPDNMSAKEIREEIIAQNLDDDLGDDLEVVYTFPPRQDKRSTSCILEVSPAIRRALFKNNRIFVRYAACAFADHIRILQCFRCLQFGHLAKDCRAKPACGHCAKDHEKDCKAKKGPPECINCKKSQGLKNNDIGHMATDGKLCPILGRKIKDKIANTNYG